MRTLAKTYTITEYGGFTRGGSPLGTLSPLPEKTFDALERFLLSNSSDARTAPQELMSLSSRKGTGKVITAKNYVGLIALKDGSAIEILPKIHDGASIPETKRVFLGMLKTLKNAPFKDLKVSGLQSDKLNILEIFISMFATEAANIAKQGLSASYSQTESNERFFKGKLNVQQNISANSCHKERFFVAYDNLGANRPENRLIKSALLMLKSLSSNPQNQRLISSVLSFFGAVDASMDLSNDFSRCVFDRSMSQYKKALSWCRIFLCGNSFTAFSGSEAALALLYPMERVFESFVAERFRALAPSGITVKIHDSSRCLFDKPTKSFRLRPDIVISCNNRCFIIDAKWKLLSKNSRNYGISQPDVYQIYTYGSNFGAEKTVLIYPKPWLWNAEDMTYSSDDGFSVDIAFIDLIQPDANVLAILKNAGSAFSETH
ncbi:MAG: McrC family protein [Clostridiales bacterium]|jgi:5-methylcytosine-specific restriction enzyme subunit McrC|nr:McrC family protein [Clostridiales bacterium]